VTVGYKAQVGGVTDYYSFGGEIAERSYDPVKPFYRFGFNTQEKTFELNRDHYTAKFWEYDARLGRRWNVDPVKKHWLSDYVVLSDNPIWKVDPDGLDDYKVDKKGNISLVKKTKDKKDNLYATDDEGNILQNKFYSLSKGVLDKKKSITTESSDNKKYTIDMYEIKGDESAKGLFEFLATNTEVEWSLTRVGDKSGNEGMNIITTSHSSSEERGAIYLWKNKYTFREHIHNHFIWYKPSDADMLFSKAINTKFPEARLKIYFKGSYYEYNEYGTTLPEIKIIIHYCPKYFLKLYEKYQ